MSITNNFTSVNATSKEPDNCINASDLKAQRKNVKLNGEITNSQDVGYFTDSNGNIKFTNKNLEKKIINALNDYAKTEGASRGINDSTDLNKLVNGIKNKLADTGANSAAIRNKMSDIAKNLTSDITQIVGKIVWLEGELHIEGASSLLQLFRVDSSPTTVFRIMWFIPSTVCGVNESHALPINGVNGPSGVGVANLLKASNRFIIQESKMYEGWFEATNGDVYMQVINDAYISSCKMQYPIMYDLHAMVEYFVNGDVGGALREILGQVRNGYNVLDFMRKYWTVFHVSKMLDIIDANITSPTGTASYNKLDIDSSYTTNLLALRKVDSWIKEENQTSRNYQYSRIDNTLDVSQIPLDIVDINNCIILANPACVPWLKSVFAGIWGSEKIDMQRNIIDSIIPFVRVDTSTLPNNPVSDSNAGEILTAIDTSKNPIPYNRIYIIPRDSIIYQNNVYNSTTTFQGFTSPVQGINTFVEFNFTTLAPTPYHVVDFPFDIRDASANKTAVVS